MLQAGVYFESLTPQQQAHLHGEAYTDILLTMQCFEFLSSLLLMFRIQEVQGNKHQQQKKTF